MPTKAEQAAWKRDLVERAEQEILALTDSRKFQHYLDTLAKFHTYSQRNVNLIYAQNPEATHVAGFKQWQTDFNRVVNQGAKSIRILAPITKRLTPEQQRQLETTENYGVVGFRMMPVFDVSQTSGDPIPSARDFVSENLQAHANMTALYHELKAYLTRDGQLTINEQPLAELNGAKGYFRPATNTIVIGADEPDSALKLKTLFHEYAHSQLHGLTAEFADRPRSYQETQAEATAYVAMKNLGIDTSPNSLGYVATWARDKDTIHAAISEIQAVSNKLIEISDQLTKKLGLQQAQLNSLTYDDRNHSISGLVQGVDIGRDKLEYYALNCLSNFDLTSLADKELKALAYNLLAQARGTHDQLSLMDPDDKDRHYWADDYQNEQQQYQKIVEILQERHISLPPVLDFDDHFDSLIMAENKMKLGAIAAAPEPPIENKEQSSDRNHLQELSNDQLGRGLAAKLTQEKRLQAEIKAYRDEIHGRTVAKNKAYLADHPNQQQEKDHDDSLHI